MHSLRIVAHPSEKRFVCQVAKVAILLRFPQSTQKIICELPVLKPPVFVRTFRLPTSSEKNMRFKKFIRKAMLGGIVQDVGVAVVWDYPSIFVATDPQGLREGTLVRISSNAS